MSRYDQMLALALKQKECKPPSEEEHQLQCACVEWFSYQYPQMRHNLFAVPNGGKRSKTTAGKLKAEGVLSGVADMIFLKRSGDYGALLIEFKTAKGNQTLAQKEWERKITADGYKYVIVRSLEQFINVIKEYLYGEKRT